MKYQKQLIEILPDCQGTGILDTSLTDATEVVLLCLCVRKRVVAIPHPDFVYIFCSVLIS